MKRVSKDQLVTIDDLDNLKEELLYSIKKMLSNKDGKPVKKWLKSAEVRKLIGFSPGKLQAVRESGLLAYTKIGGNIYYDPDDLMKLFNEQKICKHIDE